MKPIVRSFGITTLTPFVAGAFVLGLGFALVSTPDGDDPPAIEATSVAAASHQRVAVPGVASGLAAGVVPAMRTLEAGREISGGEPDPESFDDRGLDIWWRHYRNGLVASD